MFRQFGSNGSRRLGLVSVLIVMAGCGGSAPAPYTDQAGNYRILTVGSTKNSQQEVPSPAGELKLFVMENVDANKTTRTVIYTDYPDKLMQSKGPEAMLEGGVRGMGGQWNIESQKPILLDGHPGREVQFSVSGAKGSEKGAGRARLYLVGNRLYQVIIDRPEPNGNERDRFREVAQEGGVLVGARVGYVEPGRDQKVGMIQPVFQAGSTYVSGKPHGKDVPPSITVVARPGYAVGAINTRTGLFLDAFQFVFMRFRDGQLDTSDSYTSDWLGDPHGGGDGKASGDGSLVVGIHGRTSGREVNMLGLVVAE